MATFHKRAACPICGECKTDHMFRIDAVNVQRCGECGLLLGEADGDDGEFPLLDEEACNAEATNAHSCLNTVEAEGTGGGRLLLLAPANHPLAGIAVGRGYKVRHLTRMPAAGEPASGESANVAVVACLQRLAEPSVALAIAAEALAPGGLLLLLVPMPDSWIARRLCQKWYGWKPGERFFFDRGHLHTLLLRSGFHEVWYHDIPQRPSLAYLRYALCHNGSGLWRALVGIGYACCPPVWRRASLPFSLPSSRRIVTSTRRSAATGPGLSIIIPVFNEAATFEPLMEAVLAKTIEGITREIIVVESNSTDGSRALVGKYETHPEVRVSSEARPRGKGFAVRTGLAVASGDIIMIQDADLEYDINDYDCLIEPLTKGKFMFVLGSRYQGSWKLRQFNDAPITASVFNVGHIFFTWVMNTLLWTSMSDPFTMFKVFHRDLIFGLDLVCSRFDFDHELVIKLIRKGYNPIEIPVNYDSRSFSEGKKVSFVQDGLTWVWIDLKLRFGRLGNGRTGKRTP